MARALSLALAFMMASAVVQANQCSSGGGCPSNNESQNAVSLLQTKLQMNQGGGGASGVMIGAPAQHNFSPVQHKFQAHAVQSRPNRRVYFLFTTIPPHASRVQVVLKLMRSQTFVPDGVILTIPKKYGRFEDAFPMEELPNDGLLKVNLIGTDAGIGSLCKYSGHAIVDDQDIIVVGDDDEDYSHTFIEDFVSAVEASPKGAIFTGNVDHEFNEFNGLTGYSGVACRAGLLKNLPTSLPQSCLVADDVVITGFADDAGLVKYHLLKRNRDTDSSSSHDATSINTFHKSQKSKGQNVNLQCFHDLKDNGLEVDGRPSPSKGVASLWSSMAT